MAKTAKKSEEENTVLSNTEIASYMKRAETLENEIDDLKDEKKDLYTEMKHAGIKIKEFKKALQQIRNPIDEEYKHTVNMYLEQNGQFQLFN